MTGRPVALRCSTTEQCDFHRDGGPEVEACPGVCDARDCMADATIEVNAERSLCGLHGGLVLLARAMRDALAADDAATKGGA